MSRERGWTRAQGASCVPRSPRVGLPWRCLSLLPPQCAQRGFSCSFSKPRVRRPSPRMGTALTAVPCPSQMNAPVSPTSSAARTTAACRAGGSATTTTTAGTTRTRRAAVRAALQPLLSGSGCAVGKGAVQVTPAPPPVPGVGLGLGTPRPTGGRAALLRSVAPF